MTAREERVARNEATSREINERLEQAHQGAPSDRYLRMVCECGLALCERIRRSRRPSMSRSAASSTFRRGARPRAVRRGGHHGGERAVRGRGQARGHAGGGRRTGGTEEPVLDARRLVDLELEPVPAGAVAPAARKGLDQVQAPARLCTRAWAIAPASTGVRPDRRRPRRRGAGRARPPRSPGSCPSGRAARAACCGDELAKQEPGIVQVPSGEGELGERRPDARKHARRRRHLEVQAVPGPGLRSAALHLHLMGCSPSGTIRHVRGELDPPGRRARPRKRAAGGPLVLGSPSRYPLTLTSCATSLVPVRARSLTIPIPGP